MGLPFTPRRLGEFSDDASELVSVDVAVIFTCGGMYWVFRLLLLGMSCSSSDHSPSASPKAIGRGCSISGETVLVDDASSCTSSAEGHVSLRERSVELRTSVVQARQSTRHCQLSSRPIAGLSERTWRESRHVHISYAQHPRTPLSRR
jgi:hypothetical protein